MRDFILSEIRRLALSNGNKAPGVQAFATATGITEGKWRGVFWARWSDALDEAGLSANSLQSRFDSNEVLEKVAELVRKLGRMPTGADMRLHKRSDASFPNDKTIFAHFGTIEGLRSALRFLAADGPFDDILPLIPDAPQVQSAAINHTTLGTVYLLKAGTFYKIGRTDSIERRVREISVALPQKAELIHAIKTDDPVGIEAYWHRRFGDRRANGEWFALQSEDVKAFLKRTFQ